MGSAGKSKFFLMGLMLSISSGMAWANRQPLPEALVQARTTCIEGKTGNEKDTARLIHEIERFGRFRIVPQGNCDVTIAIQHLYPDTPIKDAPSLNPERDYLILTVWDYLTGERLYRDFEEWEFPGYPLPMAVKTLHLKLKEQDSQRTEKIVAGTRQQ
jgi:hypothetical protein